MNRLDVFTEMCRIRFFEKCLYEKIEGHSITRYSHSSIGREVVDVILAKSSTNRDKVFLTYRTHGFAIAKGIDLNLIIDQILDGIDGITANTFGSMHFTSEQHGIVDSNGIVAGNLPLAIGSALALKNKECDDIVICFTGDGATLNGNTHETLNFASTQKLPIVFICVNNNRGITSSYDKLSSFGNPHILARTYDINSFYLDGNNICNVIDSLPEIMCYARETKEPCYIEIEVPSLVEHSFSMGMWSDDYDSSNDPFILFEHELISLYSRTEIIKLKTDIELEIQKILSERIGKTVELNQSITIGEPTYHDAIEAGIISFINSNEKSMLVGTALERSQYYKSISKSKIIVTPIIENTMIGAACGLAMEGYKVVVDLMLAPFLLSGFDQLINQIAVSNYKKIKSSKGCVILKCLVGSNVGMGPQHSMNLQGILNNVPNVTLFYPSSPKSAELLIRMVERINGVVVLFEHVLLRKCTCYPNETNHIDGSCVKRLNGSQLTIASFGYYSRVVYDIAARLKEKRGISIEVIDILILKPLDINLLIESVCRTGKLLVVEEGWPNGALADQIISEVAQVNNRVTFNKITLPDRETPSNFCELVDYMPNDIIVNNEIHRILGEEYDINI